MNGLPLMLSKQQAADVAGCSPGTIDRMLNRGEVAFTRLGAGPRGAIRISRDSLLRRLGLISSTEVRRRSKRAEAEIAAGLAIWGPP